MTAFRFSDATATRLAGRVDPGAAHAVLHHFRVPGAMEPGRFTQALVTAIVAADPTNRARLELAFPAHVAAVQLAQGRDDGMDLLMAKARPLLDGGAR